MSDPTADATAGPARRGAARAPGAVFAVLALAVLAVVATALDPAQPPPPPVAEYAPAAVKAITEAPEEQVAEDGTAQGSAGPGEGADPGASPTASPTAPASASPDPSRPVVKQDRVSRCVGEPPRQTEDPQSPPCIPYFEGDNGGATSRGVTRDQIRVSMPNATAQDVEILERYFNTRFQLYGRQLKVVRDVGCFGGTPADAQKTAQDVAALEVFGAVGYCDIGGVEYYFYDELARRGVVSVSNRVTVQTERDLARFHPYEWTYLPTFDKGTRHMAELACSLTGKPASHGGADVVTATREFGLITNRFTDVPSPDLSAVNAALARCGIDPVRAEIAYERTGGAAGQGASGQTAQETAAAVVRMRNEGVTTIVLLTHQLTARQVFAALDGQGYQPEILLGTNFYNDEDLAVSAAPKSQSAHVFGVSLWNKIVRAADEPWYAAIKEADPGHTFREGNNVPPFSYYGARFDYHAMLVMAAGIQMAGPNLTPETFARGLQTAAWPNPPSEKHPGTVTVSVGTHSYMEDAATIWWDPASTSEYSSGGGAFCYSDNGRRRRLGDYPADPKLFVRPCQRF